MRHDNPSAHLATALVQEARLLASDEGSPSPEYDRALVELVASMVGLSPLYADDHELVTFLILGR